MMQPAAQISTFSLYDKCYNNYGDIYNGVPTFVLA